MSDAPPADSPPTDSAKLSRKEWGLLAVLAAVSCTQITDSLLMGPMAKMLIAGLRMSGQEYSFAAGVYGFTAGVCGLVASAVVDRFDRKRYLLIVFAGLLAAVVFTAVAVDFWSLLTARAVAGAFGGLTACGVLAVVGDLIPERRRGAALGALGSAFAVAAVIGLPVAFTAATASGFIWPSFVLVAVAGVGVWVLAAVKLPRVADHKLRPRSKTVEELKAVVADRNHLIAFAFMLCVGLGVYCLVNFLAPYLQANLGVSDTTLAVTLLVMGLASLGTAMLSGKLTDRFGPRPVFIGAMLLTVVITLVVANLPQVPEWVAAAAMVGYMAITVSRLVPTQTIMLAAAQPQVRGAYTTVFNSVSLLSTSVGPVLAGQIVLVLRDEEYKPVRVENFAQIGWVAVAFSVISMALVWLVRPRGVAPAGSTP